MLSFELLDYTLAVQHQRSTFLLIKNILRELGLKYSLLFPARLRVVQNGKVHFFDAPADAWTWIEERVEGVGPIAQLDKDWKPVMNKCRKQRRGGHNVCRSIITQPPDL